MSDPDGYDRPQAGPTGWTEEVWPTHTAPYLMACCDCGLVHDIVFGVVKVANPRDFGGYRPTRVRGGIARHPIYPAAEQRDRHRLQVTMRVRRNQPETVRLRGLS